MPVYNFKTICKVPTSKDFIDIILSKTQRKTPTVVRKGWKISRIRSFYARKIKYTQQNYHDRLTQILEDFPRMDEIHPFYADLINVLYSRDHYKLALGQMNTARQTIDNLGKDYLRLLKFADSLYRCKELKRAALGRMCTAMRKMNASLQYLEQVRQHLARLPSIDPNTRTLMITGYPNVGKSSFINKISRANVDVQNYAFTTKSLFVGHTDYKYLPWQVIDTPGILDHPLEARNTIEMQAITALAHLNSTVLYFVDISETCGYTIKQQAALYHSIKPLFANKPLLVVANKIDLKKFEELDSEDRALIESIRADKNTRIIEMSNKNEIGLEKVKETACDMLLQHRVGRKINNKRINDVVGRIQIQQPTKRDNKERKSAVPESVQKARDAKKRGVVKPKRRTLRDVEAEEGGPGVFALNMQEFWELQNPDWKFDVVPEIMDGKNIADFVDPDIEARLEELEREEEELERRAALDMDEEDSGLESDEQELVDRIRHRKGTIISGNILKNANNKSHIPRKFRVRTTEDVVDDLDDLGHDTTKLRGRARTQLQRKRKRMTEMHGDDDGEQDLDDSMDMEMTEGERAAKKLRGRSRTARSSSKSKKKICELSGKERSISRARPRDASQSVLRGFADQQSKDKANTLMKIGQRKINQYARAGEADRRNYDMMPKHLFSGKRGIGKTDRR